ncbi:hypothetical protein SAMN05444166_3448 [Singulisphaera sp. GP187]|uniref:transposase n=1 Tax=Singulisphaera sp. GP187 TaxID=1882752 RepID=UPI00092B60B3|nr:transposase [Singulisphaera sp. GP187]SIO28058.1 hypothetical protein SAMN05444166_3448 [Singulisphaera sp. GP187]
MPTPRSQLVDEAVTPWYHCISRCVRRASLCGGDYAHRKAWIVERLRELVEIFAIHCGGFAVMDNHLHLLLRLDSARVRAWSDQEVARRWLALFPLRDVAGQALPVDEERVRRFAADPSCVAQARARLGDLGWFMKCLKEPLARLANREDGCTGAFWEGRFRSIAVLDDEALLAVAAYIDLNPVAAGLAETPEHSEHTSLRERLDHARSQDASATLSDDLSTRTDDPGQEEGLWLAPLNDRRESEPGRVGLVSGFTLSCYLRLVDAASRLSRDGKASLPAEATSIFVRIGLDSSCWREAFEELHRPRPASRLGRLRSHSTPSRRFLSPRSSPLPRPAVLAAAR